MNMTQRLASFFGLVLSAFFLIAAIASANPAYSLEALAPLGADEQKTLFTIQGSNTIGAQLAPNLVKDYLKAKGAKDVQTRSAGKENELIVFGTVGQGRVQIQIAAHGSSTGFKALAKSQADIAASSRPIKQKEITKLQSIADMTTIEAEHIVGIDGIAIVVNPNNPINDLSVNEIAEVFSGG